MLFLQVIKDGFAVLCTPALQLRGRDHVVPTLLRESDGSCKVLGAAYSEAGKFAQHPCPETP